MKAALIGAPASGKSTVFQALTGIVSGTKDENRGTIKVVDERIDYLEGVYNPKKKTYAEFIISDFIAVPGADDYIPPKIRGLIQKTDLLIFLLRNFESDMAATPNDAVAEYNKLKSELILTDYMVVEKRLEREQIEKKRTPDIPVLQKLLKLLEADHFPRVDDFSEQELTIVANFNFLTLKKRIILVNQEEGVNEITTDLQKVFDADVMASFSISATLELELGQLPEDERLSFLESYDLSETARDRFVHFSYQTLGLISFLTSGPDEVRAWPIIDGTSAVIAAGKIHSDIQRGFIRAETVSFEDFKKHGSEAECKKAGVYRLEGKEYTVKDGDIINFRFNV